jgi:predicted NBD/HSP70 family sugar kinase
LEAYISAKAIKQRFGQEPAQLENEKAWDWIASKIAQGIQIITTVTKPDLFVLTGGIARRKGLLQKVQKHYQTLLRIYPEEATKTKIALGKYIEHAGVIGAIELPF